MKIDKKDIRKWVRALRSGKYRQGQGQLQDCIGHCCLGVACDVFVPKIKQRRGFDGYLKGNLPDEQKYAPAWLKKIDSHFFKKTNIGLPDLNDEDNFTFNEIADLLELVYIHDALKGRVKR